MSSHGLVVSGLGYMPVEWILFPPHVIWFSLVATSLKEVANQRAVHLPRKASLINRSVSALNSDPCSRDTMDVCRDVAG